MGAEQALQRLTERSHELTVVRAFLVRRRKAAREQESVALADRQVELLREMDEELAARTRATGLHEAQVLGRDIRLEGQLELAQPAARAPEADQLADSQGLLLCRDAHGSHGSEPPTRRDYL